MRKGGKITKQIKVTSPPSKDSLITPEEIVMMTLAVTLDIFGLIGFLPIIGQFLSIVPDIIGLCTIGVWTLFRSGTPTLKPTKLIKTLKWLIPLLIISEFIPFVGIAPCWTILVYLELKKKT
jgi:hypothetical protein